MFKIKSFQRRILLALLGIGLVPAALLLLIGTVLAQYRRDAWQEPPVPGVPWQSRAKPSWTRWPTPRSTDSTVVLAAAQAHQEALSESLRLSRDLRADRRPGPHPSSPGGPGPGHSSSAVFPSGWPASFPRGFSRPIQDLVGWTELIGKGDPSPPRAPPIPGAFRSSPSSERPSGPWPTIWRRGAGRPSRQRSSGVGPRWPERWPMS